MSTYDALNISLSDLTVPVLSNSINANKNWESGWRYAIGLEHKVSDKYTLMAGYAFDEGCIPYDGGDFMVPTGDRKTYSIGARYNDDKQTVAIALGWMDVGSLSFKRLRHLMAMIMLIPMTALLKLLAFPINVASNIAF